MTSKLGYIKRTLVRNLGGPPPHKKMAAQNINVGGKFRTTWQRDREYLRKETRYRRKVNGVVNCSIYAAYVNLIW